MHTETITATFQCNVLSPGNQCYYFRQVRLFSNISEFVFSPIKAIRVGVGLKNFDGILGSTDLGRIFDTPADFQGDNFIKYKLYKSVKGVN